MSCVCICSFVDYFVLFSVIVTFVSGHVRLTFPQALTYDQDFLDNTRTSPPCGMPQGNTDNLQKPCRNVCCLIEIFVSCIYVTFSYMYNIDNRLDTILIEVKS